MTDPKFTPGPWWIEPADLHQDPDTVLTIGIRAGEQGDDSSMVASVTAFSLHFQDVDGTTYVSPSDPGEEATGEAVANARLIAAAPELLEACQKLAEWDAREKDHAISFRERIDMCDAAFKLMNAAIAKATGAAQ